MNTSSGSDSCSSDSPVVSPSPLEEELDSAGISSGKVAATAAICNNAIVLPFLPHFDFSGLEMRPMDAPSPFLLPSAVTDPISNSIQVRPRVERLLTQSVRLAFHRWRVELRLNSSPFWPMAIPIVYTSSFL